MWLQFGFTCQICHMSFCVVRGGVSSCSSLHSFCLVPQGSVMGPFLFFIFDTLHLISDDIEPCVPKTPLILYIIVSCVIQCWSDIECSMSPPFIQCNDWKLDLALAALKTNSSLGSLSANFERFTLFQCLFLILYFCWIIFKKKFMNLCTNWMYPKCN